MTRRVLSPAAHGVLLAVRAALRGRVPQITDAPDGTTSVVVTDPDGTVLLRCAVRSVSRTRDTRQPLLPLAPGPQHDPPAPVAEVRAAQGVPHAPLDSAARAARGIEALAPQRFPLAVGDVITYGEEGLCRVVEVAADGPELVTEDREELTPLWSEIEEVSPGVWRDRPLPGAKAAKPKAAAKPKPARLTPVPEADELALHGITVIAWQTEEGGAWERAWTEVHHGGMRKVDAWAEAAKGHRAREYNRGGKCVRDSADGAA